MNIWSLLFEIWRRLLLAKCFFVGHKPEGYCLSWERRPLVCVRCLFNEDQMNIQDWFDMPNILSRAYGRLVDKDWHWFEVLDEWIAMHWPKWIKMPQWWG